MPRFALIGADGLVTPGGMTQGATVQAAGGGEPTLLRADNFNRSDRDLNGDTPSDSGSAWAEGLIAGTWNIVSQQAGATGSEQFTIICLEASTPDVIVEMQVADIRDGGFAIVCRAELTNENYWLMDVRTADPQLSLYYHDGTGSHGPQATWTGTVTDGDSFRLIARADDTFEMWHNPSGGGWVQRGSTYGPDTLYNANTKHGLFSWEGVNYPARVDDFKIYSST
jgi:hypothetical protein